MNPKHDIFTKRGLDPDGAVVRAQGFRRYEGANWRERRAVAATVEPLFGEAGGPPTVHDWSPPTYADPEYAEQARDPDPVRSWSSWLSWALSLDGWLMPRHATMPDSPGWHDRPVAQLRPDVPLPGRPPMKPHHHSELSAMARWQHERKVCDLAPEDAHPYAVEHPNGAFLLTGHLHPVTGEVVVPTGGRHSHYGESKYLYAQGPWAKRLGTNPLVLERGWGTPDDLFVFVMEGTLKMCSVVEAGYPAVDVGSVTLWNGTRAVWDDGVWGDPDSPWWEPELSHLGDRLEREIEAFARRHLGGRTVAVVCDSDWDTNDNVRAQTDCVVGVLERNGVRRVVRCAPPSAADGEKRGIDDWLGEHEAGDRREALLEIVVPGPAELTADHPLLAAMRRSDGRESAAALALDMGRQADARGIVAYRKNQMARYAGRSTSVQDRALENLMRCGVASQMTEAERRGERRGMTAPLFHVVQEARPTAVTLRSWLGSAL